MRRTTNHVGERFGKLTAVEKLPNCKYRCVCDCGNERIVLVDQLTGGQKTMCQQCARKAIDDARVSKAFFDGTQPSKLTSQPSAANKSGVVGVNWDKSRGKWQASLRFKGHKYNIGRFDNFDDAVKARQEAEKEIFGKFLDSYKDRK